jgi:hypothetical protein
MGEAAEWLRLARFDRLLDYAWREQADCQAFLRTVGFRELTRTQRGWRRTPRQPDDRLALGTCSTSPADLRWLV